MDDNVYRQVTFFTPIIIVCGILPIWADWVPLYVKILSGLVLAAGIYLAYSWVCEWKRRRALKK